MSTTETKVRHTPGEWKVGANGWIGTADTPEVARVFNNDGARGFDKSPRDAWEVSANADFIVRAVNSHADMLEALEYAAEIIKVARQYFPKSISNRNRFDLENTNAAINKALAKARREVA